MQVGQNDVRAMRVECKASLSAFVMRAFFGNNYATALFHQISSAELADLEIGSASNLFMNIHDYP